MRKLASAVTVLLMAAVPGAAALAQSPSQRPPWTLSENEVREVVGRVRAGRDLSPKSWPGGARVAVGLSFDFDDETITLRDGGSSVSQLSQGEYGARSGLPRVLKQERGLFILTMHPHISGHRNRAAMLERLVTYMKTRPGVWFATHEEIARYVRSEAGMN